MSSEHNKYQDTERVSLAGPFGFYYGEVGPQAFMIVKKCIQCIDLRI